MAIALCNRHDNERHKFLARRGRLLTCDERNTPSEVAPAPYRRAVWAFRGMASDRASVPLGPSVGHGETLGRGHTGRSLNEAHPRGIGKSDDQLALSKHLLPSQDFVLETHTGQLRFQPGGARSRDKRLAIIPDSGFGGNERCRNGRRKQDTQHAMVPGITALTSLIREPVSAFHPFRP